MKRLEKYEIWTIFILLIFGTLLASILSAPLLQFSLGGTFFAMGLGLMVLECSPSFWYWWIPFRLGYMVILDEERYFNNYYNIQSWLEENMKQKIFYNNTDNTFYFLNETDAAGFKLKWDGA